MSNIYYWEKLTFSKLIGKVNLSERKFEEMKLWRVKRFNVDSMKRLFSHYLFQLSFVFKTLSFYFVYSNLFCSGNKKLLLEIFRKWGWSHGQKERFHKYLGWKLKFQEIEIRFCRWKRNDYNDSNIFLSLEILHLVACEWKDLKIHF